MRYLLAILLLIGGIYAYAVTPAIPISNTTVYDSQGRIQAKSDSSLMWNEIVVRPSSVRVNPVNTKPDYITWLFPAQSYSFDAAAAESLYFAVEIPHSHKIGTGIEAHIHWAPSTTDTGNCAWKIAWMVQDINDTFAFTAGDTLSVRQAGVGTAYDHQLANLGTISMAGVSNVSAVMTGVLFRDAALASDTFTGEAIFLDLGFHFQMDSLGSRWEFAK